MVQDSKSPQQIKFIDLLSVVRNKNILNIINDYYINLKNMLALPININTFNPIIEGFSTKIFKLKVMING